MGGFSTSTNVATGEVTKIPMTQSELDQWEVDKEKEIVDKINNEWLEKRLEEYPSILELTVALYDTDDKAAIEKRRADVKAKYPKP